MVVFSEPMVQRVCPNQESDPDHQVLKPNIFNDVDPEQGQAGQEQGKQCTVNGTGQRSNNPHRIPVNL